MTDAAIAYNVRTTHYMYNQKGHELVLTEYIKDKCVYVLISASVCVCVCVCDCACLCASMHACVFVMCSRASVSVCKCVQV